MNDVMHQESVLTEKHSASDALRKIADWLDRVERERVVIGGPSEISFACPQEDLYTAAMVARLLGTRKKRFYDNIFILEKDFGGATVKFLWYRANICERVVVGKKVVKGYVVPDHEEDVVEWRCPGPLNQLAKSQPAPAKLAPAPAALEDKMSF